MYINAEKLIDTISAGGKNAYFSTELKRVVVPIDDVISEIERMEDEEGIGIDD